VTNFQDKNRKSVFLRIVYSAFGIAVLGGLVLFFAWGVLNLMFKMKETAKNRDIAQEKFTELERRQEKLISDIDNLNTDKGKEKVFREDYGMGLEGEGLIVVVEEESVSKEEENNKKRFFGRTREMLNNLLK